MFAFLGPILSGIGALASGAVSTIGSITSGALSSAGALGAGALKTTGAIAGGTLKTAGAVAGGTLKTAGAIGAGALGAAGTVVGALPTLPTILGQAGEIYTSVESIFGKPEKTDQQRPIQQPIQGQLSSFLPAQYPGPEKPVYVPTEVITIPKESPNYPLLAALGVGAYLLLRKK